MKVLIISVFPPDPAPEANHALHISELLAKSGLDVHVLCKKGSIAATRQGIVVHPVMDDWTWSGSAKADQMPERVPARRCFLLYLGWIYRLRTDDYVLAHDLQNSPPRVPCITQFEAIDTIPQPAILLVAVLAHGHGAMGWLQECALAVRHPVAGQRPYYRPEQPPSSSPRARI